MLFEILFGFKDQYPDPKGEILKAAKLTKDFISEKAEIYNSLVFDCTNKECEHLAEAWSKAVGVAEESGGAPSWLRDKLSFWTDYEKRKDYGTKGKQIIKDLKACKDIIKKYEGA